MQLGNSSPQRLLESRWSNRSMKDLDEWGGAVTVDDGLFNTCLVGHGVVALECRCPEEELIEITLNNDTIRIDGNYAIAWSEDLRFYSDMGGVVIIIK